MNMKRVVRSTFILFGLTILMLQFQNCGGANDVGPAEVVGDYDPDVQLPEAINEKLSFIETMIVTKHDADQINFDGLCGDGTSGKKVVWEIRHSITSEAFLGGESLCMRGGFRVKAKDLDTLKCEREYTLAAELEGVEISQYLKKKCPPLQVVKEKVEGDKLPSGNLVRLERVCYLELEEDDDGNEVCNRSCYANDKLFKQSIVEDIGLCVSEEEE